MTHLFIENLHVKAYNIFHLKIRMNLYSKKNGAFNQKSAMKNSRKKFKCLSLKNNRVGIFIGRFVKILKLPMFSS